LWSVVSTSFFWQPTQFMESASGAEYTITRDEDFP
jgi:hypothetical protein